MSTLLASICCIATAREPLAAPAREAVSFLPFSSPRDLTSVIGQRRETESIDGLRLQEERHFQGQSYRSPLPWDPRERITSS